MNDILFFLFAVQFTSAYIGIHVAGCYVGYRIGVRFATWWMQP